MNKRVGKALFRLAVAHNELIDVVNEDQSTEGFLGEHILALQYMIEELDAWRKGNETREPEANGNWQKPYLNS